MCGIAGIFWRDRVATAEQLHPMAAALAHRGPDGEGYWIHGNMGLAHRRLSIIDVAGGQQPITNAEENTAIVANGEIYNFKALQAQLMQQGVALKTQSDSEIPLHLYHKHGLAVLPQLHGMYAFAIADSTRNRMVLARDPFGIKPLYYACNGLGVAFASEPQALLAAGFGKRRVYEPALVQFLQRQYTAGRYTLFEGIERVLPGEMLVLENGEITQRRVHAPQLLPAATHSMAGALEQFQSLFQQAIESHLQSEVPYGLYLSGGVDSTAVLQGMQQAGAQLKTFTIGFASDSVADERKTAEQLAHAAGARHKSILFSEKDFWETLPHYARAMDDLVADYAALPVLKLSQEAAKKVKVVLSGEGGDEIFAGYGRYRKRWWQCWRRRGTGSAGDAAPFAAMFKVPLQMPAPPAETATVSVHGLTSLQRRQRADIQGWLPDDLLLKVDRCLMYHGLEGRVPMLDDALAAFGFALPDSLKVRGKHGKVLLKTWLAQQLGDYNPWLRKKGFTVPITEWLNNRRNALADYLGAHEGIADIVYRHKLHTLLAQPLDKKAAKMVFNLLCYGLWYDVHIRGQAPRLAAFVQEKTTSKCKAT